MNLDIIKRKVRKNKYVYTHHAEIERKADDLTFDQVEKALLGGEILEYYTDTGRGESCLILGFSQDIPIHIVCGHRGEDIVIISMYVPKPPKFSDPWTREEKNG